MLTPESEILSFKIPAEWVGRTLNVTATAVEDRDEEKFDIPQWHKDLVLADKLRMEENPSLLISLDTIKRKYEPKTV